MIYDMATAACFLCSVQRKSLAAKCSRARANMINREQRLKGLGVEVGASFCSSNGLPSPCEKKERKCNGETRVFEAKRHMGKGDLFLHQLSLWRKGLGEEKGEEVEDDIAGITSHGGLYF